MCIPHRVATMVQDLVPHSWLYCEQRCREGTRCFCGRAYVFTPPSNGYRTNLLPINHHGGRLHTLVLTLIGVFFGFLLGVNKVSIESFLLLQIVLKITRHIILKKYE